MQSDAFHVKNTTETTNITGVASGLIVGKTDMAPSMFSVALFVLLFSLQICYGADPQPEQIHISATGRGKIV